MNSPMPDWRLPAGTDRGLWDYLHSAENAQRYDEWIDDSPLSRVDVDYCFEMFRTPGRLLDLGCGTGRLCLRFARAGFECVGADLSPEMLSRAAENAARAGVKIDWIETNLVGLPEVTSESFDYAACLFSTLGMIRGDEHRAAAISAAHRVLKTGGRFIVHLHNRRFRRLGWSSVFAQELRSLFGAGSGDIAMPQPYGGAPLTLHHFTRKEATRLISKLGFRILDIRAVTERGLSARTTIGTYGYLIACAKVSA